MSRLDPRKIPVGLRELIPLAEKRDFRTEIERWTRLRAAETEELEELRDSVYEYAREFKAWLGEWPSYNEPDEEQEERRAFWELSAAAYVAQIILSYREEARLVIPDRVPPALRELIPLAQRWNIGDDMARALAVEGSSNEELRHLVKVFYEYYDELMAWLTGPNFQVSLDEWGGERYVFSSMFEAADLASIVLANRGEAPPEPPGDAPVP